MNLNVFFERFIVFYFRVSDLRRALEFYEQTLGFTRVCFNEEYNKWAELSFGTHQRPHLGLNLYTGGGEFPVNAGGIPSFEVEDLEALKAELERRGIPHKGIVEWENGFRFLWISDPDGNKIEFVKPGRLP